MPDPTEQQDIDRSIYDLSLQHGTPFANGAVQMLGAQFAAEPRPGWAALERRLLPSLAAILQRFEGATLAGAYREAHQIVLNAQFEADDRLEAAVRATEPATKSGGVPELRSLATVVQRVVHETEHPPEVLATPFPTLNRLLLGGFRRGELTLIGARPGMGKSAFACELAVAAGAAGYPVVVVSREMKNEAVARRMIAQRGRLPAAALRSGYGVPWTALAATIQQMYDFPIYLTDQAHTLAHIAAVVQAVPGLRLLIVDYLQLLTPPQQIRDRRIQVEAISAGLKHLTLKFDIPIVALSSLSRTAQHGAEPGPPTLASLRESGNLEHDADIVLLLHRKQGEAETQCVVAKNRDGRSGIVHLLFRPESVAFDESVGDRDADPGDEGRYGE